MEYLMPIITIAAVWGIAYLIARIIYKDEG
jgi:hypothetical protein